MCIVSLCVCSCVGIHMCVFTCVYNRNLSVHTCEGQRLMTSVFLSTLIFEAGSFIAPRVYQVISTGRPVNSILALPLWCWDSRHTHLARLFWL